MILAWIILAVFDARLPSWNLIAYIPQVSPLGLLCFSRPYSQCLDLALAEPFVTPRPLHSLPNVSTQPLSFLFSLDITPWPEKTPEAFWVMTPASYCVTLWACGRTLFLEQSEGLC